MKFAPAFLAAFSILALPLTAQDKKPKPDANKIEGAATLERLSSVDNWQTLFNGKDTSGWKNPGERGEVALVDREVHLTANKEFFRVMEKNYGDFELYVDWRIEKGGDSGIYLRGRPQVQIWDRTRGINPRLYPERPTHGHQ